MNLTIQELSLIYACLKHHENTHPMLPDLMEKIGAVLVEDPVRVREEP